MIDRVLLKEQPEKAIEMVRVGMMKNVNKLIDAANPRAPHSQN
jgi:hypothetical protein